MPDDDYLTQHSRNDPMTPFTILIDGFMQPENRSHAFLEIQDRIIKGGGSVMLVNWNDDLLPVFEFLKRTGWKINAAGHSFGCWALNAKLFPLLERRGVKVENATFADPVGRKPLSSPLTVCSNVVNFHSFVKKKRGLIRTSKLIVEPPVNWVTKLTVNANHTRVDEDPRLLELVSKMGGEE